jgi:hypothetical protein
MAQKCIASWRKYCPDYDIKEWNESNFDVNSNAYAQEAYKAKKWAFVSDYARLKILCEYGGFYMDTDSELRKPIDGLRHYNFICGSEENNDTIGVTAGFFGVTPKNPAVTEILNIMESSEYSNDTVLMKVLNNYFLGIGYIPSKTLQVIDDIYIYPPEYFSAKDNALGIYNITKNTYAVHHYSSSWRKYNRLKNIIKKLLGPSGMKKLRRLIMFLLRVK